MATDDVAKRTVRETLAVSAGLDAQPVCHGTTGEEVEQDEIQDSLNWGGLRGGMDRSHATTDVEVKEGLKPLGKRKRSLGVRTLYQSVVVRGGRGLARQKPGLDGRGRGG